MRALLIDCKLDIRKVDDAEFDRSRVRGDKPCQVDDLLLRPLTRVRRRMEISRLDLHASLCDHISCHRAVDPAGEEQHRTAVCPYRHASRPGDDLGIQVDHLADLHIQPDVRVMHIHLHLRVSVQHCLAERTVDLHGVYRIPLVRAPGLHFKRLIALGIHFPHVDDHIFFQLFQLFDRLSHDRADPHDTEHFFQAFYRLFVVVLALAVYIDPSVAFVDKELSFHILKGVPDLAHKSVLEHIPVFPLYPDLPIFDQK